jgi:hypothetical protein
MLGTKALGLCLFCPFMLNYGQNPDTPATLDMRVLNPDVNKSVGK